MKLGTTAIRLDHVQNMSKMNGAKTDILLALAYTLLEVNLRIRSFIVVRVENLVEVDYFKDTYKSAFLSFYLDRYDNYLYYFINHRV